MRYQVHQTKHLMSLGVQVIIGAHPHVLQPHCLHGNKLVAYSLGNFLFHPNRPMGGADPVNYLEIPIISPGLIFVQKAF